MRLTIGIVVFVPCATLLVMFAVGNMHPLALEFWPFATVIETAASVWSMTFLGVGMLVGLGIGWMSTMSWRRRARNAERRNRTLKCQLKERVEPLPETAESISGGSLSMGAKPARPVSSALVLDLPDRAYDISAK